MQSDGSQSNLESAFEAMTSCSARKTIFVCDQNPVYADGIAMILRADPLLSSYHVSPKSYVSFASTLRLRPDILIMNPWMIGGARESAFDQLTELSNKTSAIFYGSSATSHDVQQLVSAGFRGIIPTTLTSEELIRIVSSIAFGGTFISDKFKENSLPQTSLDHRSVQQILTDREVDVLQRVAMGSSLKEIAAQLRISSKTVDTYKGRASRKLCLQTRADIVRHAIKEGWLS